MKEGEARGQRQDVPFDGVVMLTWSNWWAEPRSNRFHYATRFAKIAPVLFIQPVLSSASTIQVEPSGIDGLDVVSVPNPFTGASVAECLDLLRKRGIRRPLLWVYSSFHYDEFLRAMPHAFRVYHATEDYLTPSGKLDQQNQAYVAETVRKLLPRMDMLVGVSQKVLESYRDRGGFRGQMVLAPNGCDSGFFDAIRVKTTHAAAANVCIFQGGINKRLDLDLLLGIAQRMPDWEFWFCGAVAPDLERWPSLLAQPNVRYHGTLTPEEFGRLMCLSTVGIIPFAQEEWIWNSLPLKAYEYVACGLPVVTVPIQALLEQPALFEVARTPDEFAAAMRNAASSRFDESAIAQRVDAAARNSYDGRFANVLSAIQRAMGLRLQQPKRLNVAVLYDDGSVHVNTVREHLEAFSRYSRHHVHYMPACVGEPPAFSVARAAEPTEIPKAPDFSLFDALVIHYSVRVSKPTGHMAAVIKDACRRFSGLKVLFIQDEYDFPAVSQKWMEDVGIDLVYTCVPLQDVGRVYPPEKFRKTEFLPTLTGYVPESLQADAYATPHRDRKCLIAYRGRRLPIIYGGLGYEKYYIGSRARELADLRGLPVDIEVDDEKRIYGEDWYRFLGSARATLGTESGSNLFDFDGTAAALIEKAISESPDCSYPDLQEQLQPYEQTVRMNQISPKIFEAIRTRTALVLFDGEYSGVVQANLHFLPLRKDFSNFDEITRALQDDKFVEQLTDRAYSDVIESGRYSYRAFVQGFDRDLESRIVRTGGRTIGSIPLYVQSPSGLENLVFGNPAAFLLSTSTVDLECRAAVEEQVRTKLQHWIQLQPTNESSQVVARKLWGYVPLRARRALLSAIRASAVEGSQSGGTARIRSLLIRVWRVIPVRLRRSILNALTEARG